MENEQQEQQPAPKPLVLNDVEKLVNEHARRLAVKYHINPSYFEVHLSTNLGSIMKMLGGSPVKIVLKWPEVMPNINTLLGDAFSAMRRFPIRKTMEIVPVAYVRTQRREFKKQWKKEKFTDESEIILDLIPRHRLRVEETVTTKIYDVVTGESITVTRTGKTDRFERDAMQLWMELSRTIREKYPEVEEIEEVQSETPELDKAVGEINGTV